MVELFEVRDDEDGGSVFVDVGCPLSVVVSIDEEKDELELETELDDIVV